jgi:hypothetical protein
MDDKNRLSSAQDAASILVMPFSKEVCAFSNRDHTWQQFHEFRNGVVEVLSRYGSVGPIGRMPILQNYEASYDGAQPGTKKPDFFVVDDDVYGMSVRVEANCLVVKPVLLEEVAMLLTQFRQWCAYLALVKGGLWVFHDRILTEGEFFSDCCSLTDLYDRCALGDDTPARMP